MGMNPMDLTRGSKHIGEERRINLWVNKFIRHKYHGVPNPVAKESSMELLDRYIDEVGRHLPRSRRSEIQAKLRSKLANDLKARAEGEPSEEEVVALLKEFGSPEKVAASYWPEGQYLIGPRLYPLFRTILGIALTVMVIVQLVLLVVEAVFNPETLAGVDFISEFIGSVISTFGIVVFVFAVLQRLDVQPESKEEVWDPSKLPAVDEMDAVRAGSLLVEITVNIILAAILIYFPGRIIIFFYPGESQEILNPVLAAYIPLLVLGLALTIVLDVFLIWRGRWEVISRLAKIGINLFGIYVLALLVVGHNAWLVDHGAGGFFTSIEDFSAESPLSIETLQILVMHVFRMAFIVAIFAVGVDTIQQGYRLLRKAI
jgi:hypothetical protein